MFLSFQNGLALFKRNKISGVVIEKCNIENIRKMQNRGCWIRNASVSIPELHYFKFFQYSEKGFPGLSIIRAKGKNIGIKEDHTYFLADFMTVDGRRIVDIPNISEEETEVLTYEILKTFDYFDFTVVKPGQILACFPGTYPYRNWAFPFQLVNCNYQEHLPDDGTSRTLVRIIENSWRLLEKHPVNKVRVDLGENPANFIWFHSQNKPVEKINLFSESIPIQKIFWSSNKKLNDIAIFLGFRIVDRIPDATEENSLVWLNVEPQTYDTIGVIRTCEFIDKEIISLFSKNVEKLIIGFNDGFHNGTCNTLNFLYPANKVNLFKRLLLTRKTAGCFLLENE